MINPGVKGNYQRDLVSFLFCVNSNREIMVKISYKLQPSVLKVLRNVSGHGRNGSN